MIHGPLNVKVKKLSTATWSITTSAFFTVEFSRLCLGFVIRSSDYHVACIYNFTKVIIGAEKKIDETRLEATFCVLLWFPFSIAQVPSSIFEQGVIKFYFILPRLYVVKFYLSPSNQQRNVFLPPSLRLAQSAAPNDCVTSSELRRIRLFICIDQILVKN